MSNKISFLKKIAAGAIGFFAGLAIGPFAFAGKWLSICREEEIGHELRISKGQPHGCTPLIVTLVFFAGGLIYGPIRGAQLGYQNGINNGCKNLVRNISNEMFTYDPFYQDIIPKVASQYPDEHLISYRKFQNAGLLKRAADQTRAPLLSSVNPLGNIRHNNKDNLKSTKTASLNYSPALRI